MTKVLGGQPKAGILPSWSPPSWMPAWLPLPAGTACKAALPSPGWAPGPPTEILAPPPGCYLRALPKPGPERATSQPFPKHFTADLFKESSPAGQPLASTDSRPLKTEKVYFGRTFSSSYNGWRGWEHALGDRQGPGYEGQPETRPRPQEQPSRKPRVPPWHQGPQVERLPD